MLRELRRSEGHNRSRPTAAILRPRRTTKRFFEASCADSFFQLDQMFAGHGVLVLAPVTFADALIAKRAAHRGPFVLRSHGLSIRITTQADLYAGSTKGKDEDVSDGALDDGPTHTRNRVATHGIANGIEIVVFVPGSSSGLARRRYRHDRQR
jgi:hypothetical protein